MESLKKYVAYYRVSTQKQGSDGLGMESQKTAVKKHIGNDVLIASFTEVESGKKNDRKELEKAIATAKENKATLVIAKLDRLSRNAFFVMKLQAEKVDFVCCDNPHANELTIGILAVIAQDEAKRTSVRTKASLAELKVKRAKAVLTGEPITNKKGETQVITNVNWQSKQWSDEARQKGKDTRKKKALENTNTSRAKRYASDLRKDGLTLEQIANKLNEYGFLSSKGKIYYKTSVMRLLYTSNELAEMVN